MKKYLLIIFCIPFIVFGQSHTINEHLIEMTGTTNDVDLAANTYYNAIDNCDVSWNIIKDSMPSGWEFSICFPDCYIIGITSAQSTFLANENIYLNCHMYHNGIAGFGLIQMEISTNNQFIDTVTWTGNVDLFTSNLYASNNQSKKVTNIIDVTGKKIINRHGHSFLIYMYDDGSFEKKIITR